MRRWNDFNWIVRHTRQNEIANEAKNRSQSNQASRQPAVHTVNRAGSQAAAAGDNERTNPNEPQTQQQQLCYNKEHT